MNKISISRNGTILGIYSPDEITERVAAGELVATDSALHEATGEWEPLGSISEFVPLFAASPESSAPPPLPDADESKTIEEIVRWKKRKKRSGYSRMMLGCAFFLLLIFFFGAGVPPALSMFVLCTFGGPGVILVIIGVANLASAATGLPPGVIPPPGYTNHSSSYSGHSGCSSCGSGGDSGGGCGEGCGGGD